MATPTIQCARRLFHSHLEWNVKNQLLILYTMSLMAKMTSLKRGIIQSSIHSILWTVNQVIYIMYTNSWNGMPDQNQNCLLVTLQNDNHSPGPGRLVPSSHQRSELSNTILCTFSRGDKRIWKCIPVPNGLGGKATLINISVSTGDLICNGMIIPAAPNQGDKVICWYTGFTLQTFV